MMDAQSVKTSDNVAEGGRGIDAGKKIKGRKLHLITDTLGLVLTVLVTATSVPRLRRRQAGSDRADGGPSERDQGYGADAGYQTGVIQHSACLGIDIE
ncbi:transposase [Streptomyces sp. NPDC003863]